MDTHKIFSFFKNFKQKITIKLNKMMLTPETGDDLNPELIEQIQQVLTGNSTIKDPYQEAQLRELGFWRWLAYEGYAGKRPMEFFDHQKNFMTSCYNMTGWDLNRFESSKIFELGCGPVGMIEFIPGAQRTAFDPLNPYYSILFKNLRRGNVQYIQDKEEIARLEPADFGICFNVLDHTDNFEEWFNIFFNTIKPGGYFILQVNTVREDFDRTPEHKKMHPSPIEHHQIDELISSVASNFNFKLENKPSADNEFFYMAWGQKN